jgi:hypothetical protein
MAGDRLFEEPWPFRFLHALPWLFYVAAIVSFTAAMIVARPALGFLRSTLAAVVAVAMVVLALALSFPLLFGISEQSSHQTVSLLFVVCLTLLPAAIAHHVILRTGAPAIAELPAHVAAMTGPILILGIFAPEKQTQLYGAWPAIVAAVPLAVVAVAYADRSFLLGRAAIAALISIAPLYLVKAWSDGAAGRGNPFAWPARIVHEFMPPKERNELIRRIIHPPRGMPARIGNQWYKFDGAGFQQPHPNLVAVPDRIQSLQLHVPAVELDVPGKRVGSGANYILLEILATSKGGAALMSKGGAAPVELPDQYIYATYEDLRIAVARTHPPFSIDAPVAWPSDDVVKARLSAYMRAHRVPEPVAAPPGTESR